MTVNSFSAALSIVIVSWNTRELLRACLQSVFDTVRAAPLQVIVVDNASADGSPLMVQRQFPMAQLIANPTNVGFARANNQGFAKCAAKYILLLNSDAQLLPGTADGLIQELEDYSNAAAVGPMILNRDGTYQAGGADFPNLRNETLLAFGVARGLRRGYYPSYPPDASGGNVDWVGGACLALRRHALEQIGGLDERYFMYTEETDWCFRARQAQWQIRYSPAQRVLHYGGASAAQASAAMKSELYKSKLLFFEKHRARWQYAALKGIFVASALGKMVLYSVAAKLQQADKARYEKQAASFRQVYRACR
ncbi:MAG: glycosyltransferase family 2 protein [Chloroflexi bacterium]|nr:MAG: glycosyltransferase family 2 protein [Chloroflexota bacterium]